MPCLRCTSLNLIRHRSVRSGLGRHSVSPAPQAAADDRCNRRLASLHLARGRQLPNWVRRFCGKISGYQRLWARPESVLALSESNGPWWSAARPQLKNFAEGLRASSSINRIKVDCFDKCRVSANRRRPGGKACFEHIDRVPGAPCATVRLADGGARIGARRQSAAGIAVAAH
jgi:hypothetical protein